MNMDDDRTPMQIELDAICDRVARKHGLVRNERFGKALSLAMEWALYEGVGIDGIEWYLDLLLKPYLYKELL